MLRKSNIKICCGWEQVAVGYLEAFSSGTTLRKHNVRNQA
jgi:hypothetical protein